MQIAPDAKVDDGYFDVINIGDLTTLRILLNGYKLYSGSHTELPEVKSRLAKTVDVSPVNEDELIDIETDGEIPGRLPARFEILPQALQIIAPTKHKGNG